MPLSEEDEKALKRPFGTLLLDAQVTKQRVSSIINGAKKVITVGDATTDRLIGFGIFPDISVVDGKERRTGRTAPSYPAIEMRCKNPAGAVLKDTINVLKSALAEKKPVRILVEGEEDMLALPLFVMAPPGSVVLYGQPLEGLVVVEITAAKKKEAKDLMNRIGVQN